MKLIFNFKSSYHSSVTLETATERDRAYSEDEADCGHAWRGHDFGTVGNQVKEGGHDGLGCVVEASAEN